jgi:hypothetical protein
MKSKKGISIFAMSIIIFFFSSCSLKKECEEVEFDIDKVIEVIIRNSAFGDRQLLLIESYTLLNYIFEDELNVLKSKVYVETDCVELKSKIVETVSSDEINPKVFDENDIVNFTKPLYQKSTRSMAVFVEFYCGSDCGGIYLYIFKKDKNKWQLNKSKLLGAF